jgi:hypothetical protein
MAFAMSSGVVQSTSDRSRYARTDRALLKSAGPSLRGRFKVKLKAKRWFATAAVNLPAASLTVDIGTVCFRSAATQVVP